MYSLLLLALLPVAALAANRIVPVGPNPESVTRGFDGKLYVTLMGETRTDGDGNGRVVRVDGDTVTPFADGLDDPKGIVFTGEHLITTDFTRVWKIDAVGRKTLLAGPGAFPHPPVYLNDVALAPDGKSVLITDMGAAAKMRGPDGQLWPLDSDGAKALPVLGRIYRISLDGVVSLVIDANPLMPCPNGVAAPDADTILVAEFFTGALLEHRHGRTRVLANGFRSVDGIERAADGTIYISEVFTGRVLAVAPDGQPTPLTAPLTSAADFYYDRTSGQLIVPDTKAGALVFVPTRP